MSAANYLPSANPIVEEYNYYYERAYYAWNPFYPLADIDLRMYLGDQWDNQEKQKLFEEGRNAYVFNLIRRNINLVEGYQRKHRLSPIAIPQCPQEQKAADQVTKLLLYAFNKGNAYHEISNCFGGGLKTGFNLLTLWKDYRDDPVNGDICFGREPYSGFITDAYFTKLDFSDCSSIIRRKYLSVDHAASLLPGQEKEVYDLHRIGWSRDDKFTWLPYQRQPNGQEYLAFNEFYQQKWKKIPALVDENTGEFMEWEGDKNVLTMLMNKFPQLKKITVPKRYVECHIILNDQFMRTETNQFDLNEYPFVPFVGIFEPESEFWGLKVQSLTRCMIDPQKEANRRRSQMIDMLDSQINSGWIAEQDSVINPRSLFQSSQGKVIWKKKGGSPDSLQRLQGAQIPAGMFELQRQFDSDIMNIAGITNAAFGESQTANESGVMMMLRQGAQLVNLENFFDNLRFAQKQVAIKCLKMRHDWTDSKLTKILGEAPDPILKEKSLYKFDINIQEGPLSDTQRQIYFRQLVDLKQLTDGASNSPITADMLIEAAPLQGKSDLLQQIQQNQQQAAQSQMQAQQLQQQVAISEIESRKARAISDVNLAKERFTRAVGNMGLEDERISESVQNRAQASLDQARAMKELESMDDDRLAKYLNIIQLLEEMNRQSERENKADDVQISEIGAIPPIQNPVEEVPSLNQ